MLTPLRPARGKPVEQDQARTILESELLVLPVAGASESLNRIRQPTPASPRSATLHSGRLLTNTLIRWATGRTLVEDWVPKNPVASGPIRTSS